jgi:hypothetical protein
MGGSESKIVNLEDNGKTVAAAIQPINNNLCGIATKCIPNQKNNTREYFNNKKINNKKLLLLLLFLLVMILFIHYIYKPPPIKYI